MINFKAPTYGMYPTTQKTCTNAHSYQQNIHQVIHHEQLIKFNTVALIFLFKDLCVSHSIIQHLFCLPDHTLLLHHTAKFIRKVENSRFTSHLDRLFSLWSYVIYQMYYWVCTAGTHRSMSILGTVHTAFFNPHQFNAMMYMPGNVMLARMMTALDLEF